MTQENNPLKNKVLLITGGTGSFGNAVCEQFLGTNVSEVRIFSRDEKKQEDMRLRLNESKLKFIIGDVRNLDSLQAAMRGVDLVFHAAALKQVPSCEFYPMEAVRTNILGAENVLTAAQSAGVSRVVVLSTDKAVYPINAMGLSKAMMEKLMVAKARNAQDSKTVFCATRYGNVMASRGSVIPLFIQQIKAAQPLTLTDPNMTRFLMSLKDSVNLVTYGFTNAQSGDIFVQKSPACTVLVLANALREMFGSTIPVKIIGTRHGEKKNESLVSREEMAKAEDLGQYFRIPADNRDLNYGKYFVEGETKITEAIDYTSDNTQQLDIEGVKALLLTLPEVQAELNA